MDSPWLDVASPFRLTRIAYERMVESGVFDQKRVELVRGLLVQMTPQGGPHVVVSRRIHRSLILAIGDRAEVQGHSGVALADDSVPEPDVAVVPADSANSLPTRAHLVVEVSDSSLRYDRTVKAKLYADAAVPEYWIVVLAERIVEVRDQPSDGEYRRMRIVRPGESVALVAFPEVVIDVGDFLAER